MLSAELVLDAPVNQLLALPAESRRLGAAAPVNQLFPGALELRLLFDGLGGDIGIASFLPPCMSGIPDPRLNREVSSRSQPGRQTTPVIAGMLADSNTQSWTGAPDLASFN